ncbi:MAG: hypothetical protein LAT67_04035 [Balneolales bacterium]|nr:hypothetical protein [Balneolales bacterium]
MTQHHLLDQLLYNGKESIIYPTAKIIAPEKLLLDDYAVICDFCFVMAGIYTKIGKYSRLSPYSMITGGGETYIHDYVDISYGAKIISGSDDIYSGYLSLPRIPSNQRKICRQRIEIHSYAYIGIHSIIFPGITIGEGAVTEPNTIVKTNLEPWTIYSGENCKKIGIRKRLAFGQS